MPREPWWVLDTETTGLRVEDDLLEVALIGASGETYLNSRLRTQNVLTPEAIRLHPWAANIGIDCPTFPGIYPKLARLLESAPVYAFHAPFDAAALTETCRRYGLSPPRVDWRCVLKLFEKERGFRASLSTACEIEGIALPPQRHRALIDAELARDLLLRLL